ncbi:hypothetical protein VTK26DRAFT_9141 [Humicola hyalothermophila]
MAAESLNTGPPPFVPGRLIGHFKGRDRKDQSDGWTSLWDTDQDDLWDRGKPSPALIDLLETREDLIRPVDALKERRPKALVPGCGKGYDVAMLALHGYDAHGLEVCDKAVETANAYARQELVAPSDYNFSDAANGDRRPRLEPGKVKFLKGDFFGRDWEASCCPGDGGFSGFDLIYDYTFLCALLPEMRKDWARRMSELLSPSGVLICLEFPLYKGLEHPGPPWGLREGIYWDMLAAGGTGIFDSEEAAQKATQKSAGGAFERVAYLRPPRSYEIAKGTDRMSIWRLRNRS